MHFHVLTKALRMAGGDHIHACTVVGKLEGEREITLSRFVNCVSKHVFIYEKQKIWAPQQ